MRYRLRTLLIAIAVVGVLLAVGLRAARSIKPSIIYELRAEFAEMPSDDIAFEEWLRTQPGVIPRPSYVDREANAIRITWIMSRDLTGHPPIPDFRNNFDRLGYKGLKRYDHQ